MLMSEAPQMLEMKELAKIRSTQKPTLASFLTLPSDNAARIQVARSLTLAPVLPRTNTARMTGGDCLELKICIIGQK
jgi:hypothetical protein